MAWFPDLSGYTYLKHASGLGLLNVGWLENGHEYPTRDVPSRFVERLELLHSHAQTQLTRGMHYCDLCPARSGGDRPWGHGELRVVAADGARFAAPSLVLHYVTAHRYAPPAAFVDAVLRTSITWEDALANDICLGCGTKMTRTGTTDGLVERMTREPMIEVDLECETCEAEYSRRFPDHRKK